MTEKSETKTLKQMLAGLQRMMTETNKQEEQQAEKIYNELITHVETTVTSSGKEK